jgi:hypothetical protein
MNIYERLVPRRMNYILFWFLVSMAIWGMYELVMFLLKENEYPLMRFMVCFLGFFILPTVIIFMRRSFQTVTQNLDQIIEFPSDDYHTWLKFETKRIFNLSTPSVWFRVGLTILVILIFSLFTKKFFYDSLLAVVLTYSIGILTFVIGIQAQHIIEKLLGFLTRTETYPIHLQLSQIDHPFLLKLFRFYSQLAVLILFTIFLMAVLFWGTPFKFSPETLVAISLVTFYPTALLVWSAYKIHRMMERAKGEHLEMILARIQASLKRIEADSLKEDIESLQILLDVKKNIKNELDWPINPESVTTLLFTILIPTVNFILTVWGRVFKP